MLELFVKFYIYRIFSHGINVYFLLRYLSSAVDKEFFPSFKGSFLWRKLIMYLMFLSLWESRYQLDGFLLQLVDFPCVKVSLVLEIMNGSGW